MKFLKIASVLVFSLVLCLCLSACSNGKISERTGDENCKHLWVKETHDKNRCTETTVITRTCEKCGKREILDEILPLGHYFPSKYEAEKDACTTCGAKVDSDCKHADIKVNRIREVTCTINGEDHHICQKCFFNIESEMIKALGHDYVNGVCSRCEKQQ